MNREDMGTQALGIRGKKLDLAAYEAVDVPKCESGERGGGRGWNCCDGGGTKMERD